ncbi:uncharacterized protein LOC144607947 [Rhinoraja longicauda]
MLVELRLSFERLYICQILSCKQPKPSLLSAPSLRKLYFRYSIGFISSENFLPSDSIQVLSDMKMPHRIHHLGLVLLLFLMGASAQDTCPASPIHGSPGHPGLPGLPGKNGLDGLQGVKGTSGPSGSFALGGGNGEKGEQGIEGFTGKVGPDGERGEKGERGALGEKGVQGEVGDHTSSLKSAFSMARSTDIKPRPRLTIVFGKEISNDLRHFHVRSGKFQCNITGLYYFTYHATSKGPLCVDIMKNGQKIVGFCDEVVSFFQVSSGGVVLKVDQGDEVYLRATISNSMRGTEGADSVFSGFLIFPD